MPDVPRWPPITGPRKGAGPMANLRDYDSARRAFSWAAVRAELGLAPDGPLNMAQIAIDRPAQATPDKLAVRFIDARLNTVDFTYRALQREANRFAQLLASHAVGRGAVVATLLGRSPELFIALLGTLKGGATCTSLFSAFGPEPIRSRLDLAAASVLVATARLYERKVAPIRPSLPSLRHVFVVRDDAATPLPAGTIELAAALAQQSDELATASTHQDDAALLHFTSGTTGKPKGVVHAHRAVIAHYATARLALDLRPDDVFWCTADPGWVTGISYGVIAALSCGVSLLVDREEFDVERWYTLLDQQQVSVWYTAPTAIRMLMKAGFAPLRPHRFPALRFIASVGEPLNPEAVMWGVDAFGLPVHDTWWQTETGAIMISNFLSEPVWPGSMGRAMPGADIAIGRRTPDGAIELLGADQVGEIVLRPDWPSMFQTYLNDEARYRGSFCDGWYLTGDEARCDAQGRFWFVGRSDDVIKSAGHLISPFEVECVLNLHPAVVQSAVIGLPDPIAGQIVKGIIELKPDIPPDAGLRREIVAHGRRLLGAAIAPRDIEFTASLPRTRSGKIMRRLLRARALGLPEGDLSMLESGA
ncbi:MAG TPA: acetate--CoA ligase [Steroidobacteraceae bacterium]|nr:acetate--CoA ligase [Steroidobacteraceae bacterium]